MRQYKVTFKVKSFVISPVFLMISSRIFLTCISPVVFSQWCQKFIKLNFSYYQLSYPGIISFLPHFGPDLFGPRLLSEPRQFRLLILGINILLDFFSMDYLLIKVLKYLYFTTQVCTFQWARFSLYIIFLIGYVYSKGVSLFQTLE